MAIEQLFNALRVRHFYHSIHHVLPTLSFKIEQNLYIDDYTLRLCSKLILNVKKMVV